MSSNIRVKKVCEHCNHSFIAKTTVTKFCSDDCAKRNYKKRKKANKVTTAILKTNHQIIEQYGQARGGETQVTANRLNYDWVTIVDLAELLGIGERTLFRRIKVKSFPKVKLGRRLLFNKQRVIDYLTSKSEK